MISSILDKFRQHPRDVGETYWEHFGQAFGFASLLFVAASACLFHAVLPFLFTSTGSAMVTKLHSKMALNRSRVAATGREVSVEPRITDDIAVNGNSKV